MTLTLAQSGTTGSIGSVIHDNQYSLMTQQSLQSGFFDVISKPIMGISEKVYEENYMSDDDDACNLNYEESTTELEEKHTLQRQMTRKRTLQIKKPNQNSMNDFSGVPTNLDLTLTHSSKLPTHNDKTQHHG